MYPCGFNVLHEAEYAYFLPIAEGIQLRFYGPGKETVNQDPIARQVFEDGNDLLDKLFLIYDDAHALPTEHIAGAYEYGIAELFCQCKRLIGALRYAKRRIRYPQPL